ncbi:CoA transferase [Halobacteriales archaeon QS_1_68_20]|nr:MAG: CoA transferase [Halobacteriales archaeon QS_1_68_20]
MRLTDVTVLDLTRLLPGPYATQHLADLGADVIKVQRPATGDEARAMAAGDGPDVFSAVNRGKRSVTLNLRVARAREAFLELAADADVVVESFRPGVADRLGVGYEAVREVAPDVVYCSLSGFGATGPNRDRAGHDLNYVGMAGLLDMTRAERGGRPAIPGFPVADMAGGLFGAFAIVAALLDRELGDGGGEYVDVGLTDVVLNLSQAVAPRAFAGEDPHGRETTLTGTYPCYDVYETADGRYVTLAALEPEFWAAFCEAVDRPDLLDRQYAEDPTEREAVRETLAETFRERTRDEGEELLGDEDAMVAPVYSLAEAAESDQARERGVVVGEDDPRVGFPAVPSGGLPESDEGLPELGEHTEAVLREHGVDEQTVAALRDG